MTNIQEKQTGLHILENGWILFIYRISTRI